MVGTGPYTVCEAGVPSVVYRPGTHRDEREGAARVDCDAPGAVELGAIAPTPSLEPRVVAPVAMSTRAMRLLWES